jgi:hypothetical protein
MSDATQIVKLLDSLNAWMMTEPVGDENSEEWGTIRTDIGKFREWLNAVRTITAQNRENIIYRIETIRDIKIRHTKSFNLDRLKIMAATAFNRRKQDVRIKLDSIIEKITEMGQIDHAVGPPEETVDDLNTAGTMWSTAELFVLAYLRDMVAVWSVPDWVSMGYDKDDVTRRKKIRHELTQNEELTINIFEGIMLKCKKPFDIKQCHSAILHQLDEINKKLEEEGATTTSEAWTLITAKNSSDTMTLPGSRLANLSICYPNTVDGFLRNLNAFGV